MGLFGIELIDTTSLDAANQLTTHLERWGIEGNPAGPLAICLAIAPSRQVFLPWLTGSAVYEAVQTISRACDLPITRTIVGGERDRITVGIKVGDLTQSQLWENLSWGIFLWAASRYPTHPAWQFRLPPMGEQVVPPSEVEPMVPPMIEPPRNAVATVISYATQPYSLPGIRSSGMPLSVPVLKPPAEAPGPRRGG